MSDGRTKKALRNMTFNMGNQVLTLVLAFVSRTVFIHGLGVAYLGISGLFTDILNMLSLADLGFNTAMVYSLYKPLKENDYSKISALIGFYRKIYIIVALTVAVVGIALIPALPYIINLETEIPHLTLYYLLSLANVVFSYLCVYKTSLLYADQKQYKITTVTIIVSTIRTILQVVSILLWKSFIVYLVIGCVGAISTNLIASHIATKEYPYIKEKSTLKKEDRKSIFQNIGSVFLYKLSTVLITATDNTLISIIVGTIAVGYYSNYLMLQNKIAMFYVIIFSSLTASIGNLIVSESEKKRYEVFECEQSISFIICSIIIPCYAILVNDFMRVWLGEPYMLSYWTVLAISLNMYLSCVLQPLWSFREATGLYRQTKWIMTICALLNLTLSVILGKLIGLTGIILATSISKLSTYIWYEPRLLFRTYFKKKSIGYYLDIAKNALLIATIILVGYLIGKQFVSTTWIYWIIKAICVGVLSFAVTFAVYYKTSGYKKIKEMIINVLPFMKRKI